jgi:hypothetical protein
VVPESKAQFLFNKFLGLCARLGLAISQTPGHVFPPARQCVALGILFDLDANTVSLPKAKLQVLLHLLDDWFNRERATDRDLASLAGKLLWAARVVQPGRLFLNRVLATKRWASTCPAAIYLDPSFKADINWWRTSLISCNGISFLDHQSTALVSMDASGSGWFGGTPGLAGVNHDTGQWFACPPPQDLLDEHISTYELLCHLLCMRLWGTSWSGTQVRGLSDSTPCVFLLKNGRSRVDIRLRMSRTFASLLLARGCHWEPVYINTHDNIMPDALSRLGEAGSWEKFLAEANRLGLTPSESTIKPWMFSFEPCPDDRLP